MLPKHIKGRSFPRRCLGLSPRQLFSSANREPYLLLPTAFLPRLSYQRSTSKVFQGISQQVFVCFDIQLIAFPFLSVILSSLVYFRGSLYCNQCSEVVISPVLKMQLEVFLSCSSRPQSTVKVKVWHELSLSVLSMVRLDTQTLKPHMWVL